MGVSSLTAFAQQQLDDMRKGGTLKSFQFLQSPQDRVVQTRGRDDLYIFSSNNYLGLANDQRVIEAGHEGLRKYGAGTGSVRFICGTFEIHDELEAELASLVGQEAALSYVACWNANEGSIPTLMEADDAIITDELNHASLIDAIRLSKARRRIYKHNDMADLEAALKEMKDARRRLVVTDGVFSMEGTVANLPDIVDLCEKYDAQLFVDDSHGTGVCGATGRGTAEHFGVEDKVDVLTSTLGKALGGAAGGFVASSGAVVDLLNQQSRPQIFSNSLPPTVASSALKAVQILKEEPERVKRLKHLCQYAKNLFKGAGYDVADHPTAIIPIILGETRTAIEASHKLLDRNIFVTGFGYPVVPEGTARLRIQVSAAHKEEDFDYLLENLKELVPPTA